MDRLMRRHVPHQVWCTDNLISVVYAGHKVLNKCFINSADGLSFILHYCEKRHSLNEHGVEVNKPNYLVVVKAT